MADSNDDINVSLSANIDALVAAMNDAVSTINDAMGKITETSKTAGEDLDKNLGEGAKKAEENIKGVEEEIINLGESLDKLKGFISNAFEAAGVTAMYEAVEKLIDGISEAAHEASEIKTMSETLGMTTDQFQAFEIKAEQAGVGMQKFEHAVLTLNNLFTRMHETSGTALEQLSKLGFTTEQLQDKSFGAVEAITVFSQALNNEATEQKMSNDLKETLGVRMAGVIPLFKSFNGSLEQTAAINAMINSQSKEQIENQEKTAAQLDVIAKGWSNTEAKAKGAFVEFWKAFQMQTELSEKGPSMQLAEAKEELDPAIQAEKRVKAEEEANRKEENDRKATAQNLAAIERENLRIQMEAVHDSLSAFRGSEAAKAEIAEQYRDLALKYYGSEQIDKVKAANREMMQTDKEYETAHREQLKRRADDEAQTSEKILLNQLDSAKKILDAQKEMHQISPDNYYAAEKVLAQERTEAEIAMYRTMAAAARDGTEAGETAYREMMNKIKTTVDSGQAAIIAIDEKAAEEAKKIADKRADDEAKAAYASVAAQLDSAKKILDMQNAEKTISPATYLQAQIVLIEERKNAEIAMYDAIEQRHQGDVEMFQNLEQKKVDATQKAAVQIVSAQTKSAQEVEKSWETAMAPIAKGFTSAFDGMLKGTETFKQGTIKIFDSILSEFERNMITVPLTKYLARMGQEVTATAEAGAAKNSIDQSTASTSLLISAEEGLKERANAAAVAAGNAYKSAAAIPYIGWILGPVEAAAAFAAVMAFNVSSAEGGMVVDRDQMAMVHEDEMVLPRHLSQGIQEKVLDTNNSGGGGNTTSNYHITAHDSHSFEKYVTSHAGRTAIARALRTANARGNSDVRRR